jgi:glycerol-3-phosphate O-acyltransferase
VPQDLLIYVVIVLVTIMVYEIARQLVIRKIARAWRKRAERFVREHRIRLESARFIDRVWMREALALDARIDTVVRELTSSNLTVPELRRRVDTYVDEIAPYFSLSLYYELGGPIARAFVNFCFELVTEPDAFIAQANKAPPDAVRVYVINHRSNFDPVVLSHALMDKIALSYAVGEWALVWPLDSLFRAFGGYFVRRGERDPLYHAVLERFVQLLAGHGAVTGFFIEGGLSRDGALRRPKSGLLDYLVRLRLEFPDRDIIFMPVGLNYDRVLEDRILVKERDGRLPKPAALQRLKNLGALIFWVPMLITASVFKVATKAHRKFGYAAICYGEPLLLSDWPGGSTMHTLERDARRVAMDELAGELLNNRIAAVVPATPVSLLCTAYQRVGGASRTKLKSEVARIIADLRRRHIPVALGQSFGQISQRRHFDGVESIPGMNIDEAILDGEEAELVVTLASYALTRRRVLKKITGGSLTVIDGEQPMVDYYVNSIRHHFTVVDDDAQVVA